MKQRLFLLRVVLFVSAQVIPPSGWVSGLPYNPARAATDEPLSKVSFPPVRAIKQAAIGRAGVYELGITERKTPMTAEEFRARAIASNSTF